MSDVLRDAALLGAALLIVALTRGLDLFAAAFIVGYLYRALAERAHYAYARRQWLAERSHVLPEHAP